MKQLIEIKKSIIPACDVGLEKFEEIVKETEDIKEVGGYKIGFKLALYHGLPKIVETVRKYTDKPIIYDHQKAGTDIPDTGKDFAEICSFSGVDAIILFPQSGPETEKAWIEAALKKNLKVIVGGEMTHPKYRKSDGGYISDEAILEMYLNAAMLGVRDFVVPGNKPESVRKIKEELEKNINNPIFYSPGFFTQGGNIAEITRILGSWHAIIGRKIYDSENIKETVLEMVKKLN